MIIENKLTIEEFKEMLISVNWKIPSDRQLLNGVNNSITTKYVIDGEIVGMARAITDHGGSALIADVIVKPNFQSKGVGRKLIENLIKQLNETLLENEKMIVELVCTNHNSNFYNKFGFKSKENVVEAGMFMWLKK